MFQRLMLAAALCLTLGACGGEAAETPADDTPEGRGQAAFTAASCNGCHGADATMDPLGTAAGNLTMSAGKTDAELTEIIRMGRGSMPAYNDSQVSDADLGDIIAFIRSL